MLLSYLCKQMKDIDGSTVRRVVEKCVEELEKRRDRPPVVRS